MGFQIRGVMVVPKDTKKIKTTEEENNINAHISKFTLTDTLVPNLNRYLITQFKPGGFLRNVTILSTGTAIAQGITVLASPVLTRIYSPGDFGILGVYLAVVPILTIISTLQYPMAIVLPKEERDAKALMGISIRIAGIMAMLLIVVAVVLKFVKLEHFGLKDIPWVIFPFIIFATFINVLGETFNYWNIRTKSFSLITVAMVSAAIATFLLSAGLGFFAAGWWGLIAGALFGKVVNVFAQLFYGDRLKVTRESLIASSDRKFAKELLKEYSDFPRYRFPQNLLNSASQNIPTIIFVTFFGATYGGWYSLARRVIGLPGLLISEAIRKVFYQKAADLHNQGRDLFTPTLKTTLGLAVIGAIPFGALILFGPNLFSFVFGNQWHTAGVYASWLAVWIYFGFCNVPSVSVLTVLKLQKQFLIYETVQFLTRIISLGAGVILGKPIISIILYALTGSALNLSLIAMVHIFLYRRMAMSSNSPPLWRRLLSKILYFNTVK